MPGNCDLYGRHAEIINKIEALRTEAFNWDSINWDRLYKSPDIKLNPVDEIIDAAFEASDLKAADLEKKEGVFGHI